LELKEAHPLHQLRPVVPHVADLGPDVSRLDRTGIRLHHRCGLVRRTAHPLIELRIIKLSHLAAAAVALAMAAENEVACLG
jgi:hypothetical protein